jgi:8-oxo-dGTP diphosphatase
MKKRHQIIPAAYLVLIDEGKILLLRRYNTGYQDGNYSMIAGHVDQGETFISAIIREAKEEAGIVLDKQDLKVIHVMHRKSLLPETDERVDVFISAEKWEGDIINKEHHKCDDLSWFELDNIPDNSVPYLKHVVKQIRNNEFYSEFGW